MSDAPEHDAARLSTVLAAALGGIFTAAALALCDARTALSVGVGATAAVLNLVVLRAILSAMLSGAADDPPDADGTAGDPVADAEALGATIAEKDDGAAAAEPPDARASKARGRRGGAAWGVFAVLKIFVLFGGIWILLGRGWVSAIPLVVGYGVLPLGITGSALLASLRPRRRRR